METLTKTYEQKKTALEQKLELAKDLGLKEQVSLIWKEIKTNEIEQKNTYEEVTKTQAREAMCPKVIVKFKKKLITPKWLFWKRDWEECQHRADNMSIFSIWSGNGICEKIVDHVHDDTKAIHSEVVGEEGNDTPMPMAALCRLKEAKDKQLFDRFEVWRPESNSEQERRMLDPWLVGVIGTRCFKLCDWR